MYTAKAERQEPHRDVSSREMHAAAMARLALRGDLERAMERSEFFVVYQPIVRISRRPADGRRGARALAAIPSAASSTRRVHAAGRGDRPDRQARAAGCSTQACRQARAWDRQSGTCRAVWRSTSTSRRGSSQEPGFVDQVAAILRAARDCPPDGVTLEFTESLLLRDTELHNRDARTRSRRSAFASRSTTSAPATHRCQLPAPAAHRRDQDRRLVHCRQSSSEPDQIAVVRSIVELAETLQLETSPRASKATLSSQALRGLDAEMGQGFLFSDRRGR